MRLFSRKSEIRTSLERSFQHVRHDMENASSWIMFLHEEHKNIQNQNLLIQERIMILEKALAAPSENKDSNEIKEIKSRLAELELIIGKMPKSPQEIRQIIDDHYMWESIRQHMRRIEEKIEKKTHKGVDFGRDNGIPEITKHLASISARLESLTQKKQGSALQQKVLKKVAKRSKDYVKNVLKSMIHKYERVSALQLREMVVEEQGLVSKSSFYRLLTELEDEGDISVLHEGKEKIYFSKMPSKKAEQ